MFHRLQIITQLVMIPWGAAVHSRIEFMPGVCMICMGVALPR